MGPSSKVSAGVKGASHTAQRRHEVWVYMQSDPDNILWKHEVTGENTLALELPNF